MTAARNDGLGFRDLDTLAEFLAHAVELEAEAAGRFDELADALAVHHGESGVVGLFRQMAHFSRLHLAEAKERAAGMDLPKLQPWEFKWPGAESPESADSSRSHYRMTPWHALTLALESEKRGHAFYAALAQQSADPEIRRLAAMFTEEEAEHVATLESWFSRTPLPSPGWERDLDPPVAVD